MTKNHVCHTPYLRTHTSYDCHFWYTFVKWYLSPFFLLFQILIFWVCRGVNGKRFRVATRPRKPWKLKNLLWKTLKNYFAVVFFLNFLLLISEKTKTRKKGQLRYRCNRLFMTTMFQSYPVVFKWIVILWSGIHLVLYSSPWLLFWFVADGIMRSTLRTVFCSLCYTFLCMMFFCTGYLTLACCIAYGILCIGYLTNIVFCC